MTTVRLATASPATQPTLKETLAQLSTIARRVATPSASNPQPADILVLPEAYLGGYPRGSTFGCAIGARTTEGRDEYLEYFKAAVDLGDVVGESGAGAGDAWVRREIGGKRKGAEGWEEEVRGDGTREELERVARETGVFLVVGLVEKAGGSLYCAVVYVCPTKGMLGKRRKVMPTGTERLIWAQGSPATLKAVSTSIRGTRINLASAICWENYMPLVRQAIYAQNVNLYLAPTADQRDSWLGLMRTIGIEGRCFVVSSNMCVRGSSSNKSGAQGAINGTGAHPHVSAGTESKPYERHSRRTSIPCGDGNEIALPAAPRSSTRARRNSILCEDGNEIALPVKNGGSPPALKKHSRRMSIPCGDGNEIIIPAPSPKTTTVTQARRNSILCEDGSEITLPCPKPSGSPTTSKSQQPPPLRRNAASTETQEWICRGGSCIVSPFGDVLAGPQWEDDEAIIYADVDFEDCIRGRLDLDAAGSYSRNDSFKFSVEGLDLEALPY